MADVSEMDRLVELFVNAGAATVKYKNDDDPYTQEEIDSGLEVAEALVAAARYLEDDSNVCARSLIRSVLDEMERRRICRGEGPGRWDLR